MYLKKHIECINHKREMVFNDEFGQFSVPDYRPRSIQSEK